MATPTDWLLEAEDDLATARKLVNQQAPKHVCFHAQQAAEKALKAMVLKLTGSIPKTHNLRELLDRARVADPGFPDRGATAATLNPYYTLVRYPDLRSPGTQMPSNLEAGEAVRLAEEIASDVRARLP